MAKKKKGEPFKVVVDPRVQEDLASMDAEGQKAITDFVELLAKAAGMSTTEAEFEANVLKLAEAAGMTDFAINKGDDIEASDEEIQIATDRKNNPVERH